MVFARKVWRLLVGIKDGLALLFLLLFFFGLYMVLSYRPNPGMVRDGALLIKLDGSVVEEPAEADPLAVLTSPGPQLHQYRARDIVRALDAAVKDDGVKAVVLDLGKFTGGGLVHMEEIGAALDRVRAAKKPVLTWGMLYGDDAIMLAAHASEAWVDPLGGAFVQGPGGNQLYFAKLLERFKVQAHVYRVGTYKEYVESYTRSDMSPEAREARSAVYGAMFENWKADVAKARPKANLALASTDPVAMLKAANGDTAEAAKAAGLIDRIGDRTDFGKRVAELAGKDDYDPRPGAYAHSTFKAYLAAHEPETPGKKIGVITVAGEIVDGKAGPGTASGQRIADLLDSADTRNLAGLVVRVDSPGGSVTASEQIRKAIERQKAKGIPVAVSMANVAASGGYWVSTPGTRIFAEPGTVTGSIGIFAVVPSFEKTLADYGVTTDGVRTTPLSGQPDIAGGFTPEVEAMLQSNIERGYQRFIGLVGASRGKSLADIDRIAQGRIWDGGTARQLGLVDQFGGLDDALGYVAQQAKLGEGDWHPVFLGEKKQYNSLLERLIGDDDSAPPSGDEDAFALLARANRGLVARAVAEAGRLVKVEGMQAYCLGCPQTAAMPNVPVPATGSGFGLGEVLAWLVR